MYVDDFNKNLLVLIFNAKTITAFIIFSPRILLDIPLESRQQKFSIESNIIMIYTSNSIFGIGC